MLLQPLRMVERGAQLVHQVRLRLGERVRIGRQDGRKMRVGKRVRLAVCERDRAVLVIDAVQHRAVIHAVFRIARDDLPLQLEQDDRHRLVHLGDQLRIVVRRVADVARQKARAGIVGVRLHGKREQRRKRDAVAVLERVDVAVLQGIDDRRRDHRAAARRGAHPQHIVVAPLHVDVVIVQKPVQDDVRAGSAVEDVADDVQAVDDEPLDEVRKRDDQGIRLLGLDDRADQLVVVAHLILGLDRVQQLVDDVFEALRQRLAHLRARVLGCGQPRDLDEPAQGDLVPLRRADARLVQLIELFLRIIDQRSERVALRLGNAVFKQRVHLDAHDAGRVFQHVQKRLVFAVDVADEVFRPLGQAQDRLQIDDLRGDLRDRRVFARKQFQVLHVRRLLFHFVPPFICILGILCVRPPTGRFRLSFRRACAILLQAHRPRC